jgi:MFS superfamily sulfate permease-like transporter
MKRLRVPLSYPAPDGFDGVSQATCRGGSFAVESVAAFAWNGWQASSGISGNLGLEYAPGITLAVLLGLFQFIQTVMRPTDTVLGVDAKGIVRSLDKSNKAKSLDGIFIYRFNSPLTYFNASYFKRRLLEQYASQKDDIQVVIIDAVPCLTHLDLSVMAMLADLNAIFRKRGVRLELAGRKRQLFSWFKKADIKSGNDGIFIHSDLYLALRINQSKRDTDRAIQT